MVGRIVGMVIGLMALASSLACQPSVETEWQPVEIGETGGIEIRSAEYIFAKTVPEAPSRSKLMWFVCRAEPTDSQLVSSDGYLWMLGQIPPGEISSVTRVEMGCRQTEEPRAGDCFCVPYDADGLSAGIAAIFHPSGFPPDWTP